MTRKIVSLVASLVVLLALASPGRTQTGVRVEDDIVVRSSDGTRSWPP